MTSNQITIEHGIPWVSYPEGRVSAKYEELVAEIAQLHSERASWRAHQAAAHEQWNLASAEVKRLRAAAQTFVDALMPLKREVIEDCGFQGEWNALCDALASSGHEPHQHVYDVRNPGVCESSEHETGVNP